jgi:hypothetical protein
VTNFLDQLIMLLSTDWFKPYWAVLGIDLDKSEKELIQKGCREIVAQIMGGAKEYWLIVFSASRREETRSMFDSLLKGSGSTALLDTAAEWTGMSDEDLKAGWFFDTLTDELLSNENSESFELDCAIKSIMVAAQRERMPLEIDFRELCEKSKSKWDRDTRQLTPTLPMYLADSLLSFITARRFKSLWFSVQDKLTSEQRSALIGWYRGVAKARAQRDIVPSYLG